MCKVSVIVPVWNAGEKIRRCLDSLLSQTLKDLEIVCVLDCPTDGTDEIVEDYAREDSRITVIRNQRNLMISMSRNIGLANAAGEYIGFCDHDDFCAPEMFESLYEEAKNTNSDVVASDPVFVDEKGQSHICPFVDFSPSGIVSSLLQPMEIKEQKQQASHCLWHSIYRKSFLQEHNIAFPERMDYWDEDRLFNLRVYNNTERIAVVHRPFYTWVRHSDSASCRDWGEDVARRSINRLEFIIDELSDKISKYNYRKCIWQLVAFDLSLFQSHFERMSKSQQIRFSAILRYIRYPIWFCGTYRISMIGRKHLNLVKYLISIKNIH